MNFKKHDVMMDVDGPTFTREMIKEEHHHFVALLGLSSKKYYRKNMCATSTPMRPVPMSDKRFDQFMFPIEICARYLEPDMVGKTFYNRIFYFPFRTNDYFTEKGLKYMKTLIGKKLIPTLSQMEGRREKTKTELDLLRKINDILLIIKNAQWNGGVAKIEDLRIRDTLINQRDELREDLDLERYLDLNECFYCFQRFEISTLYYKGGLIEGTFAVLISAQNACNLEHWEFPKVEVVKKGKTTPDWHSPLSVKCRLHESTNDPHCPAFELASLWMFGITYF